MDKRSIIIVVLIIIHEMVCAQIDSIHVIEWKSNCMADVSTLRLEDYTETVWGIDIEMVYVGGGTLRKFAESKR